MKLKNIIAAAAAVPVIFGCAGAFPASAEFNIPVIVKNVKWTVPYYIDNNTEKPYNYLDCSAEIYNDGSLKVYFRNSHDWSKEETDDKSHTVTIKGYYPDILAFSFVQNYSFAPSASDDEQEVWMSISKDKFLEGEAGKLTEDDIDYTAWSNYNVSDFSSYPNNYKVVYGSDTGFAKVPKEDYYFGKLGSVTRSTMPLYQFEYSGKLENLSTTSSVLCFIPLNIKKQDYDFVIFGETITIEADMLSDELFTSPDDKDKRIKELENKCDALENEIAELKALSDPDNILRLDANNDGIIDSNDASILLTIYAINSTGGNISKISELPGGAE